MGDNAQELPHDADIDWWVNDSDGAVGLSGTTGSTIAQLERGGPGNYSGPPDDGMTTMRRNAVHRYARIEAVWVRLDRDTRRTLRCYYELRQHPPGVRTELGRLAGVVMAGPDAQKATQAAGYLHPDPTKLIKAPDGEWVKPRPTAALSQAAKMALHHVRKAAVVAVVDAHRALAEARGTNADAWVLQAVSA